MGGARESLARLLRLELCLRLRTVGWWPVLLLLLWSLAAYAQEPQMLRTFRIELGAQAVWLAAALLLPGYFTVERMYGPDRAGVKAATNLILLVLVGLGQASLAVVTEVGLRGSATPITGLRSAVAFLLAWAPLACVLGSPSARVCPRLLFGGIVAAAALLGLGVGHAVWQDGLAVRPFAAALSGVAGGLSLLASISLSRYRICE